MATVGDAAQLFDVSDQTIRTWSGEFHEYLSPGADPGRGKPRYFTEDDLRVFAQIAQMRERRASYEEIHQALAAGDRAEPPRPEEEKAGEESRAIVTRLTATVARFEGELTAVKDERDHLRQRVEEANRERLEAEKRATEAETELRVLRDQLSEERPRAAETGSAEGESVTNDEGEEARPWWRFWES